MPGQLPRFTDAEISKLIRSLNPEPPRPSDSSPGGPPRHDSGIRPTLAARLQAPSLDAYAIPIEDEFRHEETRTECPMCKGTGRRHRQVGPSQYLITGCIFCSETGSVTASMAVRLRAAK